jgi:hypothetical protein
MNRERELIEDKNTRTLHITLLNGDFLEIETSDKWFSICIYDGKGTAFDCDSRDAYLTHELAKLLYLIKISINYENSINDNIKFIEALE